jgi:hypothetical protein
MQITIDGNESPHLLRLLANLLADMAGPRAAIHPDDNPERGVEVSGGTREAIDVTPVGANERPFIPGLQSAAAIFGGAAQAPAAPSAPAAPVQAPPAPTEQASDGAGLDKRGLPWDQRIHASTKTKKADGTWTARRNIDPALVPRVEAELLQLMSTARATDPPAPPAAPAAPVQAPPAPPAPGLHIPTLGTPPAPAAAPAAPVQAPPAPPASAPAVPNQPNTFAELMTALTPLMASGRVTMEVIEGALKECGVPALPLLGARQDLVPVVWVKIVGRLQ